MKIKIKKELKIGVIAIFILALTYWGISFLKGKNLFKAQYTYYAVYPNLDDVKVSASVYIKGVKIGSITALNLPSINSEASVSITVSEKYALPVNSVAVMRSASIMGGKAIDILVGDADQVLKNGDTIKTEVQESSLAMVDDIANNADDVMDSLKISLSMVNKLLSQENVDNISAALSDLSDVSNNINSVVASQQKNISEVVENLQQITKDLKMSMPALQSAMNNIDTLSGEMKESLPATMGKIDSLLIAITDENGTLGKLLADGEVYDNANLTLNNLQLLLADLKENPKRYVQFSVFGKKDKSEKK